MSEWTTGSYAGEYSSTDLMRMQREAEERVREMQERSRRVLEVTPQHPDFVKGAEKPRAQTETTPATTPTQHAPLHPASSSFHKITQNGSMGKHAQEQHSTLHNKVTPQHGTFAGKGTTSRTSSAHEPRAQSLPHHPIAPPPTPPAEPRSGLLSALSGSLGGLLKGGGDGPISRVLDALGIDNDKIIVLALLLILLNNSADKKLILALCYVLL